VGALVGAILVRRWRQQRLWEGQQPSRLEPRPPRPQAVLQLQGLTEAQAAARQLEAQDNARGTRGAILFKSHQSKEEIVRSTLFTVFNLSLVGLITVQLLLGVPQNAFWTTVVLVLGVSLNIARKLQVRRQLMELEQATRPQATVIRESKVRSIDPGQVVLGDVLVLGPGDWVLADGQVLGEGWIIVDESMLTGDPQQHVRQAGELVYAGSVCMAGHAAYETQKVGDERLIVSLAGGSQSASDPLTPLERTLSRILRFMLVVVFLLSGLLLISYFVRPLAFLKADAFSSAASVIFGLAPAGLFFTVLLKYTRGAEILARLGALVHRARSVESLAQATVVGFAQAGILTGMDLQLEPVEGPQPLAESRLRQVLGDYARSTSAEHASLRAIEAEFPGEQRRPAEEAPFLSLYGWSALAFDHEDLRGVYVLGDPKVLEAHLAPGEEEPEAEDTDEQSLAVWRTRLRPATQRARQRFAPQLEGFRRLLRRPGEDSEAEADTVGVERPSALSGAVAAAPGEGQGSGTRSISERVSVASDWVQHAAQPVTTRLGLGEEGRDSPGAESQAGTHQGEAGVTEDQELDAVEELVYLLAYRPDLVPLHSPDGIAKPPGDLIPLCRLRHRLEVRQGAVETMQAFSQAGVAVKVFSADPAVEVSGALETAGLDLEAHVDTSLRATSGPDLADLDAQHLAEAASENTVFGQLTPEQQGQLVTVMREQGQVVAVAGGSVNDLPAMRQAHLSITLRSGSPAALGEADLVLLKDSPRFLLQVVEVGQRVVNGLLDILRLYLVKLSYVTLLTLVISLTRLGFPYQSKQGGAIALLTVTLPSLAFVFWSPAGVLPRARFGWLLARFVAPAAVSISLVGLGVYLFFLESSGELAYAQLALTYVLALSGLAVVLLIRPPFQRVPGRALIAAGLDSSDRRGDKRPALMVLVLAILFFVLAAIPLGDQLFGLRLLPHPADYLIVGLAILAWLVLANLFWWLASRWEWWLGDHG
jgi:magnesium-transporting ATPase (P-type)